MSLMPITMQLMGWHGEGGSRTTNKVVLGCVRRYFDASVRDFESFATDPDSTATGLLNPEYNANYAFYWIASTVSSLFFFICSFRTNIVFIIIFGTTLPAVACLARVFFYAADGVKCTSTSIVYNANDSAAASGILFAPCLAGWYLFAALLLPTVDFPLPIPLGDMQGVVPSLTEIQRGHKSGWSLLRKNKRVQAEDAV
ncbi:hypothetical protein CERZMDRAFT_83618 [Cercospora zeae-maydis SCOH1-5]|uniref:Uncharacterized protein n=1 Tax=Cercospora zeae-maydis SCOH1-5 TaxID=717836 RepID=A0A6A6FJJ2_9PEZI|nr:hypothetical protein CERZMDRAFT_83618 [Cercospora zeae-maydis SCOH1-5]